MIGANTVHQNDRQTMMIGDTMQASPFEFVIGGLYHFWNGATMVLRRGELSEAGNGSVEGSYIKGTMRWSNYENTLREGFYKLQIPGTIQTNDGEAILFEARGIAAILDKSQSSKWSAAGVFYFDTGSEKYKRLNSVLAVYEGEFNMETAQARFRAYIILWMDKTGS